MEIYLDRKGVLNMNMENQYLTQMDHDLRKEEKKLILDQNKNLKKFNR